MVETVEGAGVEESVARLPEHGGHLVVVVGHQLGLGGLLGEGKQAVDILNSLESFLQIKQKYISNNVIFTLKIVLIS